MKNFIKDWAQSVSYIIFLFAGIVAGVSDIGFSLDTVLILFGIVLTLTFFMNDNLRYYFQRSPLQKEKEKQVRYLKKR